MLPCSSSQGWRCLFCTLLVPYPTSLCIGIVASYFIRDCGFSKHSISLMVDTLVISSLLFISLYLRLKLFARTFSFIKYHSWIPFLSIVLFLLPVFAWKRSVECVSPYFTDLVLPWRIIDYLRITVIVPFAEEFYFRGLVLDAFGLFKMSVKMAVVCQATAFVIIHQLLNPIGVVWTFYVGITAGFLAARYGLMFAVLFHCTIILLLIN